jgi:hypothetical protein
VGEREAQTPTQATSARALLSVTPRPAGGGPVVAEADALVSTPATGAGAVSDDSQHARRPTGCRRSLPRWQTGCMRYLTTRGRQCSSRLRSRSAASLQVAGVRVDGQADATWSCAVGVSPNWRRSSGRPTWPAHAGGSYDARSLPLRNRSQPHRRRARGRVICGRGTWLVAADGGAARRAAGRRRAAADRGERTGSRRSS